MELKRGQTIYVKTSIGINHTKGYEGTIYRINKANGEIYSVSIRVLKTVSVNEGVSDFIQFNMTVRLDLACYQIFEEKEKFKLSMKQAFYNQIDVIDRTIHDLQYKF